MNRRGHRGRVDGNHAEIVQAFRKAGWSVLSLAPMGDGCADLLVAHPSESDLYLIEVKSKRGKLTEDQLKFQQAFPVTVVRSVDDVAAVIQGEWEELAGDGIS